MAHYEKDGKFYKKTRSTKTGQDMDCEVKQCECGGWASVKLLKHDSHIKGHRHMKWLMDNAPAKPRLTLEQEIEEARKAVKDWENQEAAAKRQQIVWKNKLAKLYEKKGTNSS
jgi:hypothetical protein